MDALSSVSHGHVLAVPLVLLGPFLGFRVYKALLLGLLLWRLLSVILLLASKVFLLLLGNCRLLSAPGLVSLYLTLFHQDAG